MLPSMMPPSPGKPLRGSSSWACSRSCSPRPFPTSSLSPPSSADCGRIDSNIPCRRLPAAATRNATKIPAGADMGSEMDTKSTTKSHSSAHYLLEALNEVGIDYLFCNFGTDHAPIIEELARWTSHNRPAPRIVLCPHENVAMHMAAGYALMTG